MYLRCEVCSHGTSSFDIIGAMKPLSFFQLTALSDPIARTADRQALSIPVDFPLFLYLANLAMLAICSKKLGRRFHPAALWLWPSF